MAALTFISAPSSSKEPKAFKGHLESGPRIILQVGAPSENILEHGVGPTKQPSHKGKGLVRKGLDPFGDDGREPADISSLARWVRYQSPHTEVEVGRASARSLD